MKTVADILDAYKHGDLSKTGAEQYIEDCFFKNVSHSVIDHDRERRTGVPEVIYAEGKTLSQVMDIFSVMVSRGNNILATRVNEQVGNAVKSAYPKAKYFQDASLLSFNQKTVEKLQTSVAVLTAGTSDFPTAEEVSVTAEFYGSPVTRINDVGVAGVHRLFSRLEQIRKAKVVVVVAGMDGALPSVVGGLLDKPVIAVPTSNGYGASFGGLAALLTMLNSCSAGVSVVNIDNGFGAGYLAHMINAI